MEAAVRRTQHELRAKGDGHTLAALRDEAASVAADDIPGAIEAARAEHETANRTAQTLAARVATAQAEMERQAQEDVATQARRTSRPRSPRCAA